MHLNKLRKSLKRHELDGLLVSRPENMRYLSAYTGEGLLLVTPEHALLATDFRYWEQAKRQSPELELVKMKARQYVDYLKALASAAKGVRRIGFESSHVTVEQQQAMLASKTAEWVAVDGLVETLRTVKTRQEQELVQRAARISDAALEDLRTWLKPGLSERQVAWELEAYMRTHGADDVAFKIIVAAGANGAEAHHEPGERIVQAGEPIIVDLGACVEGYRSDITRTFWIGRPSKRFTRIYELVRQAQETALASIRAGMSGKQADGLARDVIAEAGFGKRFGHSLGHGVGLAVHEQPFAGSRSEAPLPAGATLTVEPGVYLPGWGGVRIEDLVIIGKHGVQLVSRTSKDPLI
ncbi:MAG: aminopeptidase P family protein [Thermoflexales bacterium]|nr:aminopeptidase P family protein [Thermoflexales bacterium]